MVTKYDVFYIIAKKGEIRINEIAELLNKQDYKTVHNQVVSLEREGYVKRKGNVKIIVNKKSQDLFNLIAFCIKHSMNYNILFKDKMLKFLEKVSKKEFFTINNTNLNPRTYKFYTDALFKWGFLLIESRKPLRCKLLKHHFIIALLTFFKKNKKFYKAKPKNFIKEIKKELTKYKQNLEIHYTALNKTEQRDEIFFIHTSLSLEGNPITLPDTQKILGGEEISQYKAIHIQEVTNYKKSVDLMLINTNKKKKLNLDLILEYHFLAMSHIHGAGEIRKQNVRIKNNPSFKTCEWGLVSKKLDDLMKKYEESEKEKRSTKEIIAFASYFHNEFQRIHPFIDGNSRTSRLLMLHILRSHDIPILDLPVGYFDLYLDLTKRSTKRDDKAFQQLIEEIILMDLKKLNNKF